MRECARARPRVRGQAARARRGIRACWARLSRAWPALIVAHSPLKRLACRIRKPPPTCNNRQQPRLLPKRRAAWTLLLKVECALASTCHDAFPISPSAQHVFAAEGSFCATLAEKRLREACS
eukprot:128049-Pleurochrysis_carterae.AAC.1